MAALPTSPRNISRPRRPVRSLPAEVARKIAAGEVIDRPNAILRELLDNAVDSGADQIQVEIEGGGIDRIRVVDNGIGMTKEDLENCARPHATSKITAETDLLNLSTLGFRGEALSSIAAVSRLQITSAVQDHTGTQEATAASSWRLTASVTQDHLIVPANLSQGTIVQSEALFENFPARRTFLKRPAAETLMCRQTFIEKALPRTDISFRLMIDGKQRLDLPKGQSLAQRFTEALGLKDAPELFYEIHSSSGTAADWKFTIIIGEPAVSRNDKKLIYIYVNGRKINEYSLMQAIDYGATGYFPNGTHPVAVLFLEVNPALVDFNIHPAKREARFKDLAPIHRGISQSVRNFFRNYSVSKLSAQATDYLLQEDAMPAGSHPHTERSIYDEGPLDISGKSWWQQAKANHHGGQRKEGAFDFGSAGSSTTDTPQRQDSQQVKAVQGDTGTNLRYQFFNDCYSQAAIPTPHYETKTEGRPEQALQEAYYGVQKESARPVAQTEAAMRQSVQRPSLQSASEPDDLPQLRYLGTTQGVYLVVELGDSLYLIDQHAAHERLLFNRFIAQAGQRQHLLVPYVVETSSDADDEYLRSLTARLEAAGFETKECGEGRWEFSSVPLQWQGTEADLEQDLLAKRIIPEELVASLASTNACRHAVMDGTVLDEATATQLAKDTLALEDPHCPHGRPLWLKISREDMDQGVKRT
ncbi:MAG: DNA mismatch repair endonuclease MutL [Spirochaetaceae bacterium]|nr:DNA mismatch repair endonuclease MutL [Spirochaetaceae bacterium]